MYPKMADVENNLREECPICFDELYANDVLQPCQHKVHHKCFRKMASETCPICRQYVLYPDDFYACNTVAVLKLFPFLILMYFMYMSIQPSM